MTAAGNEEKIAKAKKLLVNGAIGLIIILSSLAIVTFIINHIADSTGYSGGYEWPGPGPGPGGGPGNGVIESYYPTGRESGDQIPGRDVNVLITFRMKIKPETIIADCADDSCLQNGVYTGVLKSGAFKLLYLPFSNGSEEEISNITVSTRDKKIYKFNPADFLPADNDLNNYRAWVGCGLRDESGKSVFGNATNEPCFSWSFRITNKLDRTPPYVVSVLPKDNQTSVPINHIVQIKFSEPIDPLTVVGSNDVSETMPPFIKINFTKIETGVTGIVNGTFSISNDYRIVEFITDDLCGQNSCGGDVYCLPKDASIAAKIIAANVKSEPDTTKPFEAKNEPVDGVVDLANNSLNGNRDEEPQGNPGDNYSWIFSTSDKLDLTPPQLEKIVPNGTSGANADPSGIKVYNPNDPILATFSWENINSTTFSKSMRATSFIKDNIYLSPVPRVVNPTTGAVDKEVFYYCYATDDLDYAGEDTNVLTIEHFQLWPESYYAPILDWGIQDILQNCFQPCQCQGGTCECTVKNLLTNSQDVTSNPPCTNVNGARTCASDCSFDQETKVWKCP